MVEIEIGVLRSQCLDRKRRNAEAARIKWMFTTEKAREKLRKESIPSRRHNLCGTVPKPLSIQNIDLKLGKYNYDAAATVSSGVLPLAR